jgi:CBS domain-containing protein
MWDNDCGCVPVVDEAGVVVAMITDRDICMAAYTQDRRLTQIPVSSAASHAIFTVRDSDTVEEAEALMRRHQIRRVPVIDGSRRPIGILSMNDIARLAPKAPRRSDGLKPETVVETLAAICQPTPHAVAAE